MTFYSGGQVKGHPLPHFSHSITHLLSTTFTKASKEWSLCYPIFFYRYETCNLNHVILSVMFIYEGLPWINNSDNNYLKQTYGTYSVHYMQLKDTHALVCVFLFVCKPTLWNTIIARKLLKWSLQAYFQSQNWQSSPALHQPQTGYANHCSAIQAQPPCTIQANTLKSTNPLFLW